MNKRKYNVKLREMREYLPFLHKLIRSNKINFPSDNSHPSLLQKIQMLYDILNNNTKLKWKSLLKCEEILLKLYFQFGKSKLNEKCSMKNRSDDGWDSSGPASPPPQPSEDIFEKQPVEIPTERRYSPNLDFLRSCKSNGPNQIESYNRYGNIRDRLNSDKSHRQHNANIKNFGRHPHPAHFTKSNWQSGSSVYGKHGDEQNNKYLDNNTEHSSKPCWNKSDYDHQTKRMKHATSPFNDTKSDRNEHSSSITDKNNILRLEHEFFKTSQTIEKTSSHEVCNTHERNIFDEINLEKNTTSIPDILKSPPLTDRDISNLLNEYGSADCSLAEIGTRRPKPETKKTESNNNESELDVVRKKLALLSKSSTTLDTPFSPQSPHQAIVPSEERIAFKYNPHRRVSRKSPTEINHSETKITNVQVGVNVLPTINSQDPRLRKSSNSIVSSYTSNPNNILSSKPLSNNQSKSERERFINMSRYDDTYRQNIRSASDIADNPKRSKWQNRDGYWLNENFQGEPINCLEHNRLKPQRYHNDQRSNRNYVDSGNPNLSSPEYWDNDNEQISNNLTIPSKSWENTFSNWHEGSSNNPFNYQPTQYNNNYANLTNMPHNNKYEPFSKNYNLGRNNYNTMKNNSGASTYREYREAKAREEAAKQKAVLDAELEAMARSRLESTKDNNQSSNTPITSSLDELYRTSNFGDTMFPKTNTSFKIPKRSLQHDVSDSNNVQKTSTNNGKIISATENEELCKTQKISNNKKLDNQARIGNNKNNEKKKISREPGNSVKETSENNLLIPQSKSNLFKENLNKFTSNLPSRIIDRRRSMSERPSSPQIDVNDKNKSSLLYEDLIGTSNKTNSRLRQNRDFSIFNETDDNCTVSTQNIIFGKRRTRTTVNFNEVKHVNALFKQSNPLENSTCNPPSTPHSNKKKVIKKPLVHSKLKVTSIDCETIEMKCEEDTNSTKTVEEFNRKSLVKENHLPANHTVVIHTKENHVKPPTTKHSKPTPSSHKKQMQKAKRRNELDRLHESLQEMFMGEENILISRGRRCSIKEKKDDRISEDNDSTDSNANTDVISNTLTTENQLKRNLKQPCDRENKLISLRPLRGKNKSYNENSSSDIEVEQSENISELCHDETSISTIESVTKCEIKDIEKQISCKFPSNLRIPLDYQNALKRKVKVNLVKLKPCPRSKKPPGYLLPDTYDIESDEKNSENNTSTQVQCLESSEIKEVNLSDNLQKPIENISVLDSNIKSAGNTHSDTFKEFDKSQIEADKIKIKNVRDVNEICGVKIVNKEPLGEIKLKRSYATSVTDECNDSGTLNKRCKVDIPENVELKDITEKVNKIQNTNSNWHSQSKYKKWCIICNKKMNHTGVHYKKEHQENYISRLPPAVLQQFKKGKLNSPLFSYMRNTCKLWYHNCPFCLCYFNKTIPNWVDHFGIHTSEYRFACSKCKKTFNKQCNMEKHVRSCPNAVSVLNFSKCSTAKSGIKAHVCHLCNYMQLNRCNLDKHYILMHGFDENKVEILGYSITLMNFEGVESVIKQRADELEMATKDNLDNMAMVIVDDEDENIDKPPPIDNLESNLTETIIPDSSTVNVLALGVQAELSSGGSPNANVFMPTRDSPITLDGFAQSLLNVDHTVQTTKNTVEKTKSGFSMAERLSQRFKGFQKERENETNSVITESETDKQKENKIISIEKSPSVVIDEVVPRDEIDIDNHNTSIQLSTEDDDDWEDIEIVESFPSSNAKRQLNTHQRLNRYNPAKPIINKWKRSDILSNIGKAKLSSSTQAIDKTSSLNTQGDSEKPGSSIRPIIANLDDLLPDSPCNDPLELVPELASVEALQELNDISSILDPNYNSMEANNLMEGMDIESTDTICINAENQQTTMQEALDFVAEQQRNNNSDQVTGSLQQDLIFSNSSTPPRPQHLMSMKNLTTKINRVWNIGYLPLATGNFKFYCQVENCTFLYSNEAIGLENHFAIHHAKLNWNGFCHICQSQVEKIDDINKSLSIICEVKHMVVNHVQCLEPTVVPVALTYSKQVAESASLKTEETKPRLKIRRLSGDCLSATNSQESTIFTEVQTQPQNICAIPISENQFGTSNLKSNKSLVKSILLKNQPVQQSTAQPYLFNNANNNIRITSVISRAADKANISESSQSTSINKTLQTAFKIQSVNNQNITGNPNHEVTSPLLKISNVRSLNVNSQEKNLFSLSEPQENKRSCDTVNNQTALPTSNISLPTREVIYNKRQLYNQSGECNTNTTSNRIYSIHDQLVHNNGDDVEGDVSGTTSLTNITSNAFNKLECMSAGCKYKTISIDSMSKHLMGHKLRKVAKLSEYLRCNLCFDLATDVSQYVDHYNNMHSPVKSSINNNEVHSVQHMSDDDIIFETPLPMEISTSQKGLNLNVDSLNTDSEVLYRERLKETIDDLISKSGIADDKLYKCVIDNCNIQIHEQNFISHCKQHESELNIKSLKYKCFHCNSKHFGKLCDLKSHIKQVHERNRYFCYYCNHNAKSFKLIGLHINEKHAVIKTKYSAPLLIINQKIAPTNQMVTGKTSEFKIVYSVINTSKLTVKEVFEYGSKLINNRDELKANQKTHFSPEEINLLPLHEIFRNEIHCTSCKYKTKVRMNMLRHLQMHKKCPIAPIESNNDIVMAKVDPINPVPCLQTNEMHFDRMTNLASSSVIPGQPRGRKRPNNDISSKEKQTTNENKIKLDMKRFIYVPAPQRYSCGVDICTHLCASEKDLTDHITNTHSERHQYVCRLCDLKICFRSLSALLIIRHIKYHGEKLFQCDKCGYTHYMRQCTEKHIHEKHEHDAAVKIVSYTRSIENPTGTITSTSIIVPKNSLQEWNCSFCNTKMNNFKSMKEHVFSVHNQTNQFSCDQCNFSKPKMADVISHMQSCHPNNSGSPIEVFTSNHLIEKKKLVPTFRPDSTGIIFEFNCFYCDYTSTYKNLIIHWLSHHCKSKSNVDEPFFIWLLMRLKCPECSFIGNYTELQVHQHSAHQRTFFIAADASATEKSNHCGFCPYEFQTIKDFEHHQNIKNHQPGDLKYLNQNRLNHLLKIGSQETTHCKLCFKILFDPANHICPNHNGEDNNLVNMRRTEQVEYKCFSCSFISNSELTTMRHMIEHYSKFKICQLCNVRQDNFINHMHHFYTEHKSHEKEFSKIYSSKELKSFLMQLIVIFPNGIVISKRNLRLTNYGQDQNITSICEEICRISREPPIPRLSIARLVARKSIETSQKQNLTSDQTVQHNRICDNKMFNIENLDDKQRSISF